MRVTVTAQRGEPYLQHQGPQILQRKTSDAPAGAQLPIEHITEGDVLDRHSTLDADITNFHTMGQSSTTSAHGSDSGTGLTGQRAIAEYQSLALMGKKQSVPLHRIDEYV